MEEELQPACEGDEFPPENVPRNSCDSISDKELSGTIILAVGKREDGALDVLKAYLNGIERRVSVDTGAGASIIHNRLDPRKDRKFKILEIQRYYLSKWHGVSWRKDDPSGTSTRGYDSQYSEIYWSSEDEDECDEISTKKAATGRWNPPLEMNSANHLNHQKMKQCLKKMPMRKQQI